MIRTTCVGNYNQYCKPVRFWRDILSQWCSVPWLASRATPDCDTGDDVNNVSSVVVRGVR